MSSCLTITPDLTIPYPPITFNSIPHCQFTLLQVNLSNCKHMVTSAIYLRFFFLAPCLLFKVNTLASLFLLFSSFNWYPLQRSSSSLSSFVFLLCYFLIHTQSLPYEKAYMHALPLHLPLFSVFDSLIVSLNHMVMTPAKLLWDFEIQHPALKDKPM